MSGQERDDTETSTASGRVNAHDTDAAADDVLSDEDLDSVAGGAFTTGNVSFKGGSGGSIPAEKKRRGHQKNG